MFTTHYDNLWAIGEGQGQGEDGGDPDHPPPSLLRTYDTHVKRVPWRVAHFWQRHNDTLSFELPVPRDPTRTDNQRLCAMVQLLIANLELMLAELTTSDPLATPASRQLAVIGVFLWVRRMLRRMK